VRPAVSTASAVSVDTFDPLGAAETTMSAVVRLEVIGSTSAALGSGVLFRSDGHLVTNAHVVQGAEAITVVLADGRRLTGSVVGVDTETDIAVVRLVGEGPFPVATFGSVADASVGEPAVVIGASRRADGSPTVTSGQVSALGREVRSESGLTLLDMIQSTATMAPGSSGGALMDTQGRVIGICTAFALVDGQPAAGYATPIDVARAVAVDLLAGGTYRPAWLGIRGADRPDSGVTLVDVLDASPAALAGLRPGDVVMAVDKEPMDDMSTMRIAMRVRHPGDQIAISYQRAGQLIETRAALVARPPG
jgi:S1-C subfamily serine protease